MNLALRVSNYAQKHKHVQQAVAIIEQAIERFGLDKLSISFNGGKDCTVVLHLIQATIQNLGLEVQEKESNNNRDVYGDPSKLLAFYYKSTDLFEEEEKFVNLALVSYNLKLAQYSCGSLKNSLTQFKLEHPNLEGIFIGTRLDDLKKGRRMTSFEPTDPGWPSFVRVNPILEWSYQQVWDFIRQLEVPYCDLYNQGYSSFGAKSDSRKNSRLMKLDPDGQVYYAPAWCLADHQDERYSRS